MGATVATVAYLGLETRAVEVQVQLSSGLPAFIIVGLPDKAVAESRERGAGLGAEPVHNTPGEFAAFLKADLGKWAKVVRESGAKID